jgi:hypothetical protein
VWGLLDGWGRWACGHVGTSDEYSAVMWLLNAGGLIDVGAAMFGLQVCMRTHTRVSRSIIHDSSSLLQPGRRPLLFCSLSLSLSLSLCPTLSLSLSLSFSFSSIPSSLPQSPSPCHLAAHVHPRSSQRHQRDQCGVTLMIRSMHVAQARRARCMPRHFHILSLELVVTCTSMHMYMC